MEDGFFITECDLWFVREGRKRESGHENVPRRVPTFLLFTFILLVVNTFR